MIRYAIAGLFAVAMVGVAYADHKPNHNPGGETEPPAPQPQVLVLRDANDTVMGTVLTNAAFSVVFAYEGDPAQSVYFDTVPVVLLRANINARNELEDTRLSLLIAVEFSEVGCDGIPYYPAGTLKDFNLPQLGAEELIDGPVIYVPTDPSEPQVSATVGSTLSGTGFPYHCDDVPGGPILRDNLVQAVAVNLTFVPPYTVGY